MNPNLIMQPLMLASHLAPVARQLAEEKASPRPTRRTGRLIEIDLVGVVEPQFLRRFRTLVNQAAADPSVAAIVIYADSPGGAVNGSPEAAEAVARAAKIKEVHVVAEGFLASAAYFIACHATSISAASSTTVGAIGSTITLVDDSELWRAAGVKFLHITTGLRKVVGYEGQPVLQEHVEMLQSLVDHDLAQFEAAVERGRKLYGPRLAAVTDGAIWKASVAKSLGLIDHVVTPEERLAELHRKFEEKYTDLQGQAAVDKVNSLVSGRSWAESQASEQDRLRREHPKLVAAAEAHQCKVRRHPWRYDERGELLPTFR